MISSKKFWDFKHTRSHKNLKSANIKLDVIRTFTFNKSFLLEIKLEEEEDNTSYVIPYRFMSNTWPYGFYTGIGERVVSFTDSDIVNVINE